jgi:hypothetical protein
MAQEILVTIARRVVDGYPLGRVYAALGADVAQQVHELTISRPWQRARWVRRVR